MGWASGGICLGPEVGGYRAFRARLHPYPPVQGRHTRGRDRPAWGRGSAGFDPPVLASLLPRQYRVATRGIEIGLRVTHQAVDVAGGVVGAVAGHFGLANGDGETTGFTGEVVRDADPGHERPQSRPERPEPRRQPPPPVPPA